MTEIGNKISIDTYTESAGYAYVKLKINKYPSNWDGLCLRLVSNKTGFDYFRDLDFHEIIPRYPYIYNEEGIVIDKDTDGIDLYDDGVYQEYSYYSADLKINKAELELGNLATRYLYIAPYIHNGSEIHIGKTIVLTITNKDYKNLGDIISISSQNVRIDASTTLDNYFTNEGKIDAGMLSTELTEAKKMKRNTLSEIGIVSMLLNDMVLGDTYSNLRAWNWSVMGNNFFPTSPSCRLIDEGPVPVPYHLRGLVISNPSLDPEATCNVAYSFPPLTGFPLYQIEYIRVFWEGEEQEGKSDISVSYKIQGKLGEPVEITPGEKIFIDYADWNKDIVYEVKLTSIDEMTSPLLRKLFVFEYTIPFNT